ncbi:MAG: glycosyltransferase [Ignavibacteria bacterium]|nr:glycosyltransferase [Ignavibacteria bacterium]
MSSEKQISIILPTLNEEKLIYQTLSQFTPYIKEKFSAEVIISDGGSTDKTIMIAQDFADKIVTADKKQNIPIGRNEGAKVASGKYFYFFNADTLVKDIDYFFSRSLEIISSPRYDAIACNVYVFPEDEKFQDKLFHGFYNNYVRFLNFLGMGMGRGECHIIKKEIFERLNGYNESLAAGEDFDLYKRISRTGRIKFAPELVVYESPRRYRKFGYIKVFGAWTRNSISVLLRNKSVSEVWEAVR